MTETTRAAAEAALAQAGRATAVILPEPAGEVVPLAEATPEGAEAIRRRMAEVDLGDTGSIIAFGSRAQAGLQEISQAMLAGVRNKDLGPAGESLRGLVAAIRGFSAEEVDPRRERSLWERVTGRLAPVAEFQARFEEVRDQIERITRDLLGHETALLKDIEALDRLYDRTLAFHDEIALYIAAGEERLRWADAEEIPAAEAAAAEAGPDGVIRAQGLRDLRAARADLERRVHDLRLTRTVTMQALPSIRLVQENDKGLVTRIGSTLANTVPLWETQLAQALTVQRSADAASAVREAGDLTNELLTRNAESLREANRAVRAEVERGAFDVEAVRAANASLIATIEDSLRLTDEGRARRAGAEAELSRMEAGLRTALAAARAPAAPGAPGPT